MSLETKGMNPENDYILPDADHKLAREDHKHDHVDVTGPSEHPTVIILGGQPGSGKSAMLKQAMNAFPTGERPVRVDVDILRESHPAYDELKLADDRTAAGLVQSDSAKWGDELVEDARKARRNIIIDGTLKSPEKAEALCRQFKAEDYRTEIWAMAVSKEDSDLGVYGRYEAAKADGGHGRWVPEKVRDEAYSHLPISLKLLNQSDAVDKIQVHGRLMGDGTKTRKLYDQAPGKSDPVAVLKAERSRQREPQEQEWFETETRKVRVEIEKRDPNLSEPENRDFVERIHSLEQEKRKPKTAGQPSSSPKTMSEKSSQEVPNTNVEWQTQTRSGKQSTKSGWTSEKSNVNFQAEADALNEQNNAKSKSVADRWRPSEQKSLDRERTRD